METVGGSKLFDCQVCLALPPSPSWCFPSLRPPSEMWNSKGPSTPAHQTPCVELSSDVTLKSRPHPKYIRQHLQTNVPKGPFMVDYPYETILNMFHMNSAHSNQIYQNHLACILTSLFRASRWKVFCQINTTSGIS